MTDRPMIVPDEQLGLAVLWRGGATFNVHSLDGDVNAGAPLYSIGSELTCFTKYSEVTPEDGQRPRPREAFYMACDWLDSQREAETEGGDADLAG